MNFLSLVRIANRSLIERSSDGSVSAIAPALERLPKATVGPFPSIQSGPTTVEEKSAIVEGSPSALRGHVTRRAIEMEPSEALGPGARDASIAFEDRRGTIKGCVGGSPRNRRRRSTWSAIPE